MPLIILLVLLLLALAGGGWGYSRWGYGGFSPAGLLLIILGFQTFCFTLLMEMAQRVASKFRE